jgi:hypothetical protein
VNIVILFSSSSSSSSSGRGKELISHDIYRNNTVKERERERTNPPEREREREREKESLLCYVRSVLNVCVYKYRENCLFLRFRFSDSLLERRFLSLFSILFFSLSFAFLKIWFFSFFSHTTPAKEVKKNKKGEHEPSGIVYAQGTPSFLARE